MGNTVGVSLGKLAVGQCTICACVLNCSFKKENSSCGSGIPV